MWWTDPCAEGEQFSSVEDVLLGSLFRSDAEGKSFPATASPQIILKQFSNIYENVVYFFYYVGGGKMIKDFRKTITFFKNKNGQFF